MASITENLMESNEDYVPPVKLKKTTSEVDHNDLYCFECHDEGDVICCDSCPRVYHPKCLGLTTLPDGDWTCPECKITQSSLHMNDRSIDEFHSMLKYALRRMKSHPQAAPFMQPVDFIQMPEYLDYIVHPMDLETIEKNIDRGKYTSTDAFIADVKWITHNSVVFNGSQSKFSVVARALLKIARHEMMEIEICSECYLRSAQPAVADWFAEPCTIPHALCWAKMKGYQPWPAKVLRIVNDEVDVRFFGQHDRAWVSINNCFALSKEYPGVEKKKSNTNFEKSLLELQTHIDRLKALYGSFSYAPLQTPLSKVKPFKFVSVIDDSVLPTYVTLANNNNSTLRSSIKCARQTRSPLPQQSTDHLKNIIKRRNESAHEQQQESVKRVRLLSRPVEDNNQNSNRIVLRIRKPSEDHSSNRSDVSNSSSSNPQLSVQIKEPLEAVREDEDEDHMESQASNVFDIFNQTSNPSNEEQEEEEEPSTVSPKSQSLSPPPPLLPANEEMVEKLVVIDPDVRLTLDALLDNVDALETIAEVPTQEISANIPSTNESKSVQLQFAERRTTTKQSRKSRLQQRIVISEPKSTPTNTVPLPPIEQHLNERSLSPATPTISLRTLSASPANLDIPGDLPTTPVDDLLAQYRQLERTSSIDTLSVKSEPMDESEHKKRRAVPASTPTSSSSICTKSFLISPPANTNPPKLKPSISSSTSTTTNAHYSAMITNSNSNNNNNTFAPRIPSTVSQKTHWPASLPLGASNRQPLPTAQKRPGPPVVFPPTTAQRNVSNPPTMRMTPSSSLQSQSFDAFSINPPAQRRPNGITHTASTPPVLPRNPIRMPQLNNHPVRPAIEDLQTPAEIQLIIKNFNDKFQQLLNDFTVKIDNALELNRVKYEKELEETRRTYRQSMNELRTITTQQVQEMRNSLELQYWTRLSEMRNRYETTLQQPPLAKSSKQFNGGPR